MSGKILITGPPRTGTTLLVALFHKLGFDTGYSDGEFDLYYRKKSNGFEYMTDTEYWASGKDRKNIPYVIKEPFRLKSGPVTVLDYVKSFGWTVDSLIICNRTIYKELEESYIRLIERKRKVSLAPDLSRRYALENHKHLQILKKRCEEGSYRLLRQITTMGLNPIYLEYPRYKEDFDYCYEKLGSLSNLSKEDFYEKWDQAIDKTR